MRVNLFCNETSNKIHFSAEFQFKLITYDVTVKLCIYLQRQSPISLAFFYFTKLDSKV